MGNSIVFLLPCLDDRDLGYLKGCVGASIGSPGNLPAVSVCAPVHFAFLAPERLRSDLEAISFLASVPHLQSTRILPVDDLLVDGHLPLVRSLVYQYGMRAFQSEVPNGAFVFLCANRALADGSLRHIASRIQDGAQALTATHLSVEAEGFCSKVRGGLQARDLVRSALSSLSVVSLSRIMNSGFPLLAERGPLLWRQDHATLRGYDPLPELIAIRPDALPVGDAGYKDVSFVPAMCRGSTVCHLGDSDNYFGVDLVGQHPAAEVVVALGKMAHAVSDGFAETAWHAEELSATSNTPPVGGRRSASATDAVSIAGDRALAESTLLPWNVAHYLWNIRRFELGKGHLPRFDFGPLLPASTNTVGSAPVRSRGRSLLRGAKAMLEGLMGRVPLVTPLHPDWLEYRSVARTIRGLDRGKQTHVYIGDGKALLSRALGAPSSTCSQIVRLEHDEEFPLIRDADWLFVEADASNLAIAGEVVSQALPLLASKAKVCVFCRGATGLRQDDVNSCLLSLSKLSRNVVLQSVSMTAVAESHCRSWLQKGFSLGFDYARQSSRFGLIKGVLLAVASYVPLFLQSCFSYWRPTALGEIKKFASLTVVIELGKDARL